jgi:hypothetical protein
MRPFRFTPSRAVQALLLPVALVLPAPPAAAQTSDSTPVAYVSNRGIQNVTVAYLREGRPIPLGRVESGQTREFRLPALAGEPHGRMIATVTSDRSLNMLSDPIPLVGTPATWEIIQMPTREVPRGHSSVVLRRARSGGGEDRDRRALLVWSTLRPERGGGGEGTVSHG